MSRSLAHPERSERLAPAPEPEQTLALLQRTSLTRVVHEAIEALILSGELPPGTRLSEAALAQRLGVSRGPLREALRLLEECGLVRQEKHRGAYVREIALDEAAQLYELRAGLDALAGRLLAASITPAQLAELRATVQAMQTLSGDELDRFHQLNLGFHDRIVEMTGNAALVDTYARITRQLVLYRRRNLMQPHAVEQFASEHAQIVELLARGDGVACAEALHAHAHGGRARMLADGQWITDAGHA